MRHVPMLSMIALLAAIGCSGGTSAKSAASASINSMSFSTGRSHQQAEMSMAQQAAEAPAPAPPEPSPRKIIYDGTLHLVVADVETAGRELQRLVDERKGYVVQSDVGGPAASARTGQWRVRVPVDRLQDLMDAVRRLGVAEMNRMDSKDVTEEYADTETRIRVKKAEEARLLKHLDTSTGKLDEILTVERELTRVRGEVEHQEGRLRLLANLTELATLTVTAREEKPLKAPETLSPPPTFGETVGKTFFSSVDVLLQAGRIIVLIVVALAPWLPLVLFILALGILVWRRSRRVPAVAVPANPPA